MPSTHTTLSGQESSGSIRSRSCPSCYLCGSRGEVLHENLEDRLFGAPGIWDLKRCPDRACGLLWLDPMPLEEDIGEAYKNYYTHHENVVTSSTWLRRTYGAVKDGYVERKYGYFGNSNRSWKKLVGLLAYFDPVRRADFDLSVLCLRAKPNGHLLDVGCGSGAVLQSMQRLGWHVEGVDFDPKAVREAKSKGLIAHLGTLEEQDFPGDVLDAVTMRHVVEHVFDPLALLKECHRILKPGGQLVVLTPNGNSWGHSLYGSHWRGLEPPRHLHIFNSASLSTACVRAGFNSVCCQSLSRDRGIFLASRSLRRTGRIDPRIGPTFALRLWAQAMGSAEYLRSQVDHDAGEEVLMRGVK